MLHSQNNEAISADAVADLEARVRCEDDKLDQYFAVTELTASQTESMKYEAERAIYHLHCKSLLICINALRQPSSDQRQQMERLVASALEMFLELPTYGSIPLLAPHANHFMLGAIWQIQVLGCALYNKEQLERFMAHYSLLEKFLDPGHRTRARAWLQNVATILDKSTANLNADETVTTEGRELPAGLTLLNFAGGTREHSEEDVQ